jgi:tetratricopeptide (TPR) repeat protein
MVLGFTWRNAHATYVFLNRRFRKSSVFIWFSVNRSAPRMNDRPTYGLLYHEDTAMSIVHGITVLAFAWTVSSAAAALPQTPAVEIRATGEYALIGTPADSAKQLALADARRKALQDAVAQLRDLPEVQTLPLKPTQLEAYAAALLDPEEQSGRSITAGPTYRAEVLLRFDPNEVAVRMRLLRKDQDATFALLELWTQMQDLQRKLAEMAKGSGNAGEQQRILTALRMKHLAAQVQVAIAKTEEGSTSARVSSAAGRTLARKVAESAIAEQDSPDAHYAMGDVLAESGQAEADEAEYRKALLLDPNSSSGHTRLAYVLRLQSKFPEAATELHEALRINPNSVAAHTDLGSVLGSQNNAAEAISEYQAALRLDPDFIEAHNNLAVALARQRRIPAAVAEFREIVRIDPDSALGYFNMASALADMEKDAESAEALREAVRINPNHYNAHYNLGELFRLETKYDEAVKQFKEYLRLAVHLAPDTPQTQRNIRRAKEFIQAHDNP